MARIEVSTVIEAPVERVWDVLTDWEAQPRWMVDARSVTVLTPHREGRGVVLSCRTAIAGGLAVNDRMVTTEWLERSKIGVRHLGPLIRGIGAFDLEPTPEGTRFRWWEELDPPLGRLGDLVARMVVVPAVARVFRSSLVRLKALCEAGP
jgi:uncharacterized membrane protein